MYANVLKTTTEIPDLRKCSDTLLWDWKLSSGASCFHWSSLMFLQLDWSPPVINSIDCTWFGKAHTCQYKVPQLTVHVRAKTKPWGLTNSPYSSETVLWRRTDLGKGTKTCMQHWRTPRTQWPSILKGSFEPPRLFLELAARPNWAIGENGLGQGGGHFDRASLKNVFMYFLYLTR